MGDSSRSSAEAQLGQILLQMKLVTLETLAQALAHQKAMQARGQKVFRLGEILLFMKAITVTQLHAALRQQNRKDKEVAEIVQQMKRERDELKRLDREQRKKIDEESTTAGKIAIRFRKMFGKKT